MNETNKTANKILFNLLLLYFTLCAFIASRYGRRSMLAAAHVTTCRVDDC